MDGGGGSNRQTAVGVVVIQSADCHPKTTSVTTGMLACQRSINTNTDNIHTPAPYLPFGLNLSRMTAGSSDTNSESTGSNHQQSMACIASAGDDCAQQAPRRDRAKRS